MKLAGYTLNTPFLKCIGAALVVLLLWAFGRLVDS